MSPIKVLIFYYSSTGTIYQLAHAAQEAAQQAGAQVRLRKVRELAPDVAIDHVPAWRAHLEATRTIPEVSHADLEWADAYIVGTPARYGNIAAQLKQFIDTTGGLWYQGKLVNRVAAGFTSAANDHGGQESTLLALYNTFYHWGCFIVPPGYTDQSSFAAGGNPYGVSVTSHSERQVTAEAFDATRHLARRIVQAAGWLRSGRQAA